MAQASSIKDIYGKNFPLIFGTQKIRTKCFFKVGEEEGKIFYFIVETFRGRLQRWVGLQDILSQSCDKGRSICQKVHIWTSPFTKGPSVIFLILTIIRLLSASVFRFFFELSDNFIGFSILLNTSRVLLLFSPQKLRHLL